MFGNQFLVIFIVHHIITKLYLSWIDLYTEISHSHLLSGMIHMFGSSLWIVAKIVIKYL